MERPAPMVLVAESVAWVPPALSSSSSSWSLEVAVNVLKLRAAIVTVWLAVKSELTARCRVFPESS